MKMQDLYDHIADECDQMIEQMPPLQPQSTHIRVKRKWWQFWKPKYQDVPRYTLENSWFIGKELGESDG